MEAFDPFALAALHVDRVDLPARWFWRWRVADKRLTAEEAFALSQIDERFQAEKWGLDPRPRRGRKRLDAGAGRQRPGFMDLSRA